MAPKKWTPDHWKTDARGGSSFTGPKPGTLQEVIQFAEFVCDKATTVYKRKPVPESIIDQIQKQINSIVPEHLNVDVTVGTIDEGDELLSFEFDVKKKQLRYDFMKELKEL